MNSIIKQLNEVSYNNPIFGKTTYRNIVIQPSGKLKIKTGAL